MATTRRAKLVPDPKQLSEEIGILVTLLVRRLLSSGHMKIAGDVLVDFNLLNEALLEASQALAADDEFNATPQNK